MNTSRRGNKWIAALIIAVIVAALPTVLLARDRGFNQPGATEQALQRLEGGAARLRTPVGRALNILDQVEVAAREWGRRVEAEGPLSAQILVTLHDRFSQEMEAADQTASVVGEAAQAFNKSLSIWGFSA
jgi:hypothetical protein